jgi:hypothetical protein
LPHEIVNARWHVPVETELLVDREHGQQRVHLARSKLTLIAQNVVGAMGREPGPV